MTQSKIESRLQSVLAPRARRRGITSIQALFAALIAALSVTGLGALRFAAQGQGLGVAQDEEQVAMRRLKMLSLATIIYANDYDDLFPYVQTAGTTRPLIAPYLKDQDSFESPTPGGKFVYNMNVGGVPLGMIESPADTLLWTERLPDKSRPAVAWVDGHVSLIDYNDPHLLQALKQKFVRPKSSKPLPVGYLVTLGKPGN